MERLVSWKIGGEQGQGIDSTGDMLTTICNRLGYFVYAYKEFSSRIKGGHSNYKVRIGRDPVAATSSDLQILVAIDQNTIDLNAGELVDGLVIADAACNPVLPPGSKATLVSAPMTKIATQIGNPLVRNVISLGITAHLLGLPLETVRSVVADSFQRKGANVVDQNDTAVRLGHAFAAEHILINKWHLQSGDHRQRLVMTGNEAAALGALAAGCRFISAYPITPASEVFEWLAKYMPEVNGVALQCEDEIAAVMAAIGAGYAGARAMTSTSGPGLSLMQEALGLAHMAEVPLVVVDVQRGGPSTGMPTRHEQSDVFAALYGSHGDSSHIVLAPSTVEEVFYDMVEAFNLADKNQCPVFVMLDLALGFNKQTVNALNPNMPHERGALVADEQLADSSGHYSRYTITSSGVSPRPLPGQPGGQYLATGLEHNEYGKVCEDAANRRAMVDKRARKIKVGGRSGFTYSGTPQADVILVGFGSTRGALEEAERQLSLRDVACAHVHIRTLAPFPTAQLMPLLKDAKKIIIAENNASGQLAQIFVGQVANELRRQDIDDQSAQTAQGAQILCRVDSLLKYDGRPFLPGEIVAEVEAKLSHAYAG